MSCNCCPVQLLATLMSVPPSLYFPMLYHLGAQKSMCINGTILQARLASPILKPLTSSVPIFKIALGIAHLIAKDFVQLPQISCWPSSAYPMTGEVLTSCLFLFSDPFVHDIVLNQKGQILQACPIKSKVLACLSCLGIGHWLEQDCRSSHCKCKKI